MPGIEPAAAAGARLEQDRRERRRQPGVEVVHAEDVAVEELALPVGRQAHARRLGDVPVHVPLDVRDRRAAEDLATGRRRGGRRSRAGTGRARTGCGARSVPGRPTPIAQSGCVGEQPAALADHLWLDPQAELHAQAGDRAGQPVDPVGQLAPVDGPVAERAGVVVPRAEPAVVEHEQLDPEVMGRRPAMASSLASSKSK